MGRPSRSKTRKAKPEKAKPTKASVRAASPKPVRTPKVGGDAHARATRAISGDIDGLLAIVDSDVSAYTWLSVASDFGHPTDPVADRVMKRLSSRQVGSVHFQLGLAYLRGAEGLPRDLDKAYTQLQEAALRDYPMSASPELLEEARIGLDEAAFAIFNSVYTDAEEVPSEDDADEEDDFA